MQDFSTLMLNWMDVLNSSTSMIRVAESAAASGNGFSGYTLSHSLSAHSTNQCTECTTKCTLCFCLRSDVQISSPSSSSSKKKLPKKSKKKSGSKSKRKSSKKSTVKKPSKQKGPLLPVFEMSTNTSNGTRSHIDSLSECILMLKFL